MPQITKIPYNCLFSNFRPSKLLLSTYIDTSYTEYIPAAYENLTTITFYLVISSFCTMYKNKKVKKIELAIENIFFMNERLKEVEGVLNYLFDFLHLCTFINTFCVF